MRKSRQEAAETRQRVVQAASQEFRRNGIEATGLVELMAAAGLTRGGFYKHFTSKEQVVDEAMALSTASMLETWGRAMEDDPGTPSLNRAISDYLSLDHCADAAGGCALAALAGEVTRLDGSVRETATKAFLGMVELMAKQLPDMSRAAARKEALWMVSSMIGAMTMARMVTDPDVSASIVKEARKHLMK
jgi:TetR/AcrR family transcriptional repressor of nem operon